jgi:hypothetical protein
VAVLALANVAIQLPILIAVAVGALVVLTRGSRLPRRSVVLAMVSLAVTVLNVVLGVVWMTVSPYLATDMWKSSDSTTSIGLMYFVASIVLNLVAAVGLLLSFLAVGAAARPADPAATSPELGGSRGYALPPHAMYPDTAGAAVPTVPAQPGWPAPTNQTGPYAPASPPPGSGWPNPPSAR